MKRIMTAVAGIIGLVLATTGCVPTIFQQYAGNPPGPSARPYVIAYVRPTGNPEDSPWFYVAVTCWPNTRYSTVYNINDMPASLRHSDASGDYMIVTVYCDYGETAIGNSAQVIRL